MGGGKSHGLIGLWHLAAHPAVLATTDTGREAFAKATAILDGAASSGPRQSSGRGPGVRQHDRWEGRRRHTTDRHGRCTSGSCGDCSAVTTRFTCGTRTSTATRARSSRRSLPSDARCSSWSTRSWTTSGSSRDTENADLAVRDMAFLRALLDSVNDVQTSLPSS